MQENNFEKQVQQKMDGLTVNPSGEVWKKLSVAIIKEKKDRRLIAFLLFFLLLLIPATYLFLNILSYPKNSKTVVQKNNRNITDGNKNTGNKAVVLVAGIAGKKSMKPTVSNTKAINIGHHSVTNNINPGQSNKLIFSKMKTSVDKIKQPANINLIYNKHLELFKINKQKKIQFKTSTSPNIFITKAIPAEGKDDQINLADLENNMILNEIENKSVNKAQHSLQSNQLHTDSIINNTTKIIELLPVKEIIPASGIKKDEVQNSNSRLKQKQRWKFGVNISAGASTTKNGFLGVIGSGNGDASKAYADINQNNTTPGNTILYPPSSIKTGAGFLVGAFMQKSISVKSSIHLGVNYKMLGSSILIGNRVDSAVVYTSNPLLQSNFYYRNGNQNKYRNHFHFIEFPLSITMQLGKQKESPVYLNAGFSFAQLIGSDALQFDGATSTYFHNNDLLHKTSLSITAGLLFALFPLANNPLLIGPDINFSINKIAKTGFYSNNRYSYLGITMRKTIGKE